MVILEGNEFKQIDFKIWVWKINTISSSFSDYMSWAKKGSGQHIWTRVSVFWYPDKKMLLLLEMEKDLVYSSKCYRYNY